MKFRKIVALAFGALLLFFLLRVFQYRYILFPSVFRDCDYEVTGDFCVSGADCELKEVKPRAEPVTLNWNVIRNSVVTFDLGGATEFRASVRLDVAKSRVALAQKDHTIQSDPRSFHVLEATLSGPELEALLAELFPPAFLDWAQGSAETYDSVAMDGTSVVLEISSEAQTWKVSCWNYFPGEVRRFGCVLSDRVRSGIFKLDRETWFLAATYEPPKGVTVRREGPVDDP